MVTQTPPLADELEVSVFGRGVGESVTLHLGDGKWAVFDSCLADDKETPAPLQYLQSIGVDVSKDVVLVAASHWHDDHIRGIANLFRETSSAQFGCSAALRNADFFTVVASRENLSFVDTTSGINEFFDVLEVLEERGESNFAVGPSFWGAAGSRVHLQDVPFALELLCVSPSAQSVTDGFGNVAKMIEPGQPMGKRFPNASPNEQSMAMMVVSERGNILLGADLENGRDDLRGWRAVLNTSSKWPKVRSKIHKVAHHGSPNAHHDDVWRQMIVEESPVAVVTTYNSGRQPRPSEEDVKRLLSLTTELYCTTSPIQQRTPKRRGIDGLIQSSVRSRRVSGGKLGQVQVRLRQSEEPAIQLFGEACRL